LEQSDKQQARLLGEVLPGESVGEVGLLTGEKRSAGVRAIRDSLLIRLDRKTFEDLATRHPSLVMKLASNVANMLRRKGRAENTTRFNTIALVPLENSPRVQTFCRDLTGQLDRYGENIVLGTDSLLQHGAPAIPDDAAGVIPDGLKNWLHEQETRVKLLVYACTADDGSWTRFAMRQSDLVIFIADSQSAPGLSDWESRLLDGKGTATGKQALVLLQPPSDTAIRDTARWLAGRQADFHLHVRQDKADDIARVARVLTGNALGLVLSGGAARGFAHLGIYRALLEYGVSIDWVGGASIGSIFGAAMAADWSYEHAYNSCRHSFVKVKPFSDYTLPIAALIRGRRMERELKAQQDYQIEDLPIPFFCVSSVLDNGELQLHETGWLPNALRASASLPAVIPPAVVNKRLTIDGVVLNSMPVDIMREKPVGKVIAVDLSSYKSYEVDYESIPSPWAILAGRYLPFFRKYRVPSLATTILKATEIGTLAQVRQSGQLADLLLQPPVRKFGLTDVKAFDRIVEAGYQYAKVEIQEWVSADDCAEC
jgi:predicted acylesterase/phospholipase RssA